MTVLITGGTRTVGARVIEDVLARGESVRTLSRRLETANGRCTASPRRTKRVRAAWRLCRQCEVLAHGRRFDKTNRW
jgi:nucleoside-diphosphate-sugar epimerase